MFYFKDEDENLGEEMLQYMPEVARLEFQLHRYRIEKYYPAHLSLYTLLTNELATARAWNAMLDEYHIGGKICRKKALLKSASRLFAKNVRVKRRKMRQLKQFNDTNSKVKRRSRTIEQMKDVIKELDAHGICPYSCEVTLNLKEDCIKILLKKRVSMGSICYAHWFPQYRIMGHSKPCLDTS